MWLLSASRGNEQLGLFTVSWWGFTCTGRGPGCPLGLCGLRCSHLWELPAGLVLLYFLLCEECLCSVPEYLPFLSIQAFVVLINSPVFFFHTCAECLCQSTGSAVTESHLDEYTDWTDP